MVTKAGARDRSRHWDAMRTNPPAMATYRALRKRLLESIEAGEKVYCAICRKRILYGPARARGDQLSLSIDHIRRYRSDDPATWDASNLRPTHQGCNQRRNTGADAGRTIDEPAAEYSRW
jgi:5-methylcytosine-specific restriction endonuclease McrA